MTYGRRKTTIVVLLSALVLTVSYVAQAECAWVLWDDMASMVGTELKHTWQVEGVYATRDPCEHSVSAYFVTWNQQRLEITAEGVAIARQRLGEAEALLLRSHKCLPDTVDPRERKGGGW